MPGRIRILSIIILVLSSCSRDETASNPQPVIYSKKYSLEITKDYRIIKVSFESYNAVDNYVQEYYYYTDSVVVIKKINQPFIYRSVYFLNQSKRADSCRITENSKSYFKYDSNGYLTSKTDRSYSYGSKYEYTNTYKYIAGNLTKLTFDSTRFSLTGKYVLYTYTSYPNLIDIRDFSGPWLGKLNSNLAKTYFVGGSMSDFPPCQNYEYNLNEKGLVDTMTIFPCNPSFNYKTIVSFEYHIIN
jgi:hypothetical protein